MTGGSQPLIILGAAGQVGSALAQLAPAAGFAPIALGSAALDLRDAGALRALAAQYPAAPLINAAAYTAVDAAEVEREAAFAVNATAPAQLALLFGWDRPLIHYSTDYVFDGSATEPYTEDSPTAPLGVYGLSKRIGERAVLGSPFGTVIRTAWVYADGGKNFLRTMLRVGRERGAVRVVADQIGTPTHAADIAAATLALLRAQESGNAGAGIYHYVANGTGSWYDFASEIFTALAERTGITVGVTPIGTADYPTPAQRPAYSVLATTRIASVPGVVTPPWRARVRATVANIIEQERRA